MDRAAKNPAAAIKRGVNQRTVREKKWIFLPLASTVRKIFPTFGIVNAGERLF